MSVFPVALCLLVIPWMMPTTVNAEQTTPVTRARQAEANGVVNTITPGHITLTHEAIPILGWPPLKMNFEVAKNVDTSDFHPGLPVRFTVREIKPGHYRIVAISPQDR